MYFENKVAVELNVMERAAAAAAAAAVFLFSLK